MATEPRPPLANRRTYFVQRGPGSDRLPHAQEMLLLYGPAPEWRDAFASIEEARVTWERYRGRLLSGKAPGRRVWAWYEFEAPPGLRYDYDRERSALYDAGLLSEGEKAALEREWRDQFDRAQRPDFGLCLGSAGWLRGDAARQAHYEWADIPQKLIAAWSAARP